MDFTLIIARAPYRISFAGGGTDLPAFYQHEPGAVLSTTIDRYVYVSVHPAFGRLTRVNHRVSSGPLESLVDRAINLVGIKEALEIGIVSDLPSGTGMGGSGALCCALAKAVTGFCCPGIEDTWEDWKSELVVADGQRIEDCEHGGVQDICASAYGGFNYFRFVDGMGESRERIESPYIAELERHCLLCYTGQQRDARPILEEQAKNVETFREYLKNMAELASYAKRELEDGHIRLFAKCVHDGWEYKRVLAQGICTPDIDAWYETALRNGAWGGKICGAGGGGFMLLIAPPERHATILEALNRPQAVPVKFSGEGARVIFDDRA